MRSNVKYYIFITTLITFVIGVVVLLNNHLWGVFIVIPSVFICLWSIVTSYPNHEE